MIHKTSWIWDERFLHHDTGKIQYVFEGGETVEPCDEFENKHRMNVNLLRRKLCKQSNGRNSTIFNE